jgi:hypothetical protein
LAGEKLGRGLGKMEEGLGKVLARRIEAWWSKERDRWGVCSARFVPSWERRKEMRERREESTGRR